MTDVMFLVTHLKIALYNFFEDKMVILMITYYWLILNNSCLDQWLGEMPNVIKLFFVIFTLPVK